MKTINVAINGFGRIGRAFVKLSSEYEEINIVAINDLGDVDNLAYLLKYDSVYGRSNFEVHVDTDEDDNPVILVNGKPITILSEPDPKKLPWKKFDIDVVVESTGVFRKYEDAEKHIKAGAKRVVISAPAKSDGEGEQHQTILMGVNDDNLNVCSVSSNASCTTNAGSPVMTILDEGIGIEKAVLNTIHGYTATQSIVDGPNKGDFRKGRAAAQNIIPSTTGAAIATAKALPQLKDKFDGVAMRVPVIVGSIADITFIAKRDTSVEEINELLQKASLNDRWSGIFSATNEPIVSQDIVGNTNASIADLSFTKVVDGNLVKVLAWYDNEVGYTHSLVKHVIKTGGFAIEGGEPKKKKIKAKKKD
jgi:glyceraldehyde 3-phosphate dehydrogenase